MCRAGSIALGQSIHLHNLELNVDLELDSDILITILLSMLSDHSLGIKAQNRM